MPENAFLGDYCDASPSIPHLYKKFKCYKYSIVGNFSNVYHSCAKLWPTLYNFQLLSDGKHL